MAVRILDLRQQRDRCKFENTPDDELRYAEAFWQSVKLQPTMESRLVSSDIKQRLGKRNTSSKSGASTSQCAPYPDERLNELFVRARTLDQIQRFQRLCKLSEARAHDRSMLHKRREERIKKELISRDKVTKPTSFEEIAKVKAMVQRKIGEAYSIEEMFRDIDKFEKMKSKNEECMMEQCEAALMKKEPCEPEITVLVSPLED